MLWFGKKKPPVPPALRSAVPVAPGPVLSLAPLAVPEPNSALVLATALALLVILA